MEEMEVERSYPPPTANPRRLSILATIAIMTSGVSLALSICAICLAIALGSRDDGSSNDEGSGSGNVPSEWQDRVIQLERRLDDMNDTFAELGDLLRDLSLVDTSLIQKHAILIEELLAQSTELGDGIAALNNSLSLQRRGVAEIRDKCECAELPSTPTQHPAVVQDKQCHVLSLPNATRVSLEDEGYYMLGVINAGTTSCPFPMRYVVEAGVCARPISDTGSCVEIVWPTPRPISKIKGFVRPLQFGHPDGVQTNDLVSFTFVRESVGNVPLWCYWVVKNADMAATGPPPPSWAQDISYVDTAVPSGEVVRPVWYGTKLFPSGVLDDYPGDIPWFSASVDPPQTGRIEVRVCLDESSVDEDIGLESMAIFVK